jgi:hypothetical protein
MNLNDDKRCKLIRVNGKIMELLKDVKVRLQAFSQPAGFEPELLSTRFSASAPSITVWRCGGG